MTLDVQVYFVIPNGCEQDECSEEMHQAYITCEQHRGGGLNARWILEDDCMRLQNVTKKDVFVLEEFDGAVFEKLKSSKCLLVGPRCLSCCLMEGVAIPSGPEPVFTVAMRGLIVTASGLTKLQKDKIKERVHWMGGLYRNQLTNDTTHLISSTVLSDKYIKSVELGIPIMSITWVTDVWDTSLTMNVNGNSMEFNKHRLKPFNNLHITTSGIGKKEKQSIIKLVTENGGTFTGAFQSETTDIVIMTKEGIGSEKYKAAIEFGKACVHPLWIQHSVERHYAQPVAKYKIAGASTSSPLAHHNLPDISLNFSRITNSRPTSNVVNETTDSSVIASCRTKLSQEVKKTNDSQLVDKDIMIAFEKFDMNSIKKAGPVFDGFFVWVVGGSGICRERACGLVSRGGGVRYDCPGPRVTHAVAMSAAAATKAITELPNVPVVSAIWLIKSVEAEKALDVTEFLMNEEAAGNTSGSTKKSRLEPSSPLSKKNLQMLRPPCPPPPAFNDNLLGNVQDDILQQYKSHTSATTSSKSNISSDPRPNVTEVTGSGEEEPTEEPEQIFEGIKFEVQSLDEETLCELSAEITASGGILLPTGGGGSHALVPLDFDVDELANKNAEAVTVFWVKDCLTQQELVPIQYYHKPVRVVNATALHDVVLSLSTYSGVERAFLDELATLMGATTQLRFCRRAAADALASTHLLCPEPTGDKYAGAVRWGLPAVTARWLLDCAAAGKRLHEQLYLVGDTKAPSLLTPDETKDKENVITIEKRKSVSDNTELRDSSKEHTPRVKQIDIVQGGVDGDVDMSPASRYIAMARQGLLNADSQETPKRMKDVQQEQVAEGVVRTPPLDEALSTPNLAALSPTTRRRIQAVRRGEMPSDPIRTPKNPFDSAPGTPDSAFGAALRPGSGLSPGTRKRLWRQVQHLPGKQPSPAVNKQTPLSEIRNRFLAQFAEGAPTPPTDHGLHGPRKLQLPDQSDTPPAKIPKFLDNQSPSAVVDGQCSAVSKEKEKMTDKSTSHHEGVDSQLRRLSAALTGGDATPSHLRLRRQKDSSASIEAIEMGLGTETEEPPFSQANTVHWDDGPTTQPAESDADAAKVVPAPEPECAPPIKRFMLSNNVDSQQDLSEMIVSLGGEVCSSSELDPSATHLLCAAPVRSEKMLGAVAAGKWALHPAYIARSRLHGAFLPEEEYEWGNPRALSLPPLSALEQAVARAAHRWRTARAAGRPGAFAGLRALLHMPPARRLLLSKLLRAGDGIVIDDVPPYSAEDVTLCLADFRRYPISERDAQWLRDRRVPVCPYILLFSYLTDEQPPDPKEHCLPEFRL